MKYFKCGDRVQLKDKKGGQFDFDFAKESGIVVGHATLQSGVPCVILSMDVLDSNGIRHDNLVAFVTEIEELS